MTQETTGRNETPWGRRILLWGLLLLVLMVVTGVALVDRWAMPENRTPAAEPLPDFGELPSFSLTATDGRTVTKDDLSGDPWIADFVFTRCQGTCPVMSLKMGKLDRELPPELDLVSITVDPEHDTPAVLAEYAKTFEASERWHFLTGSPDEILALSQEGFRLGLDLSPPEEQATPEEPILHSTRFVLVDARGHIRGYYNMMLSGEMERLLGDLAAL